MADNDCGMIPVVDKQGMPLGTITDRDIAVRAVARGGDMNNCCAGDYMSEPARTVSQDSTLADCCAAMESAQLRRMPVVDSPGRGGSEERRVGKECDRTCRSRLSPYH